VETLFITGGDEGIDLGGAAGGRRQAVRPDKTTIPTTAAKVSGSVAETPEIWLARKRMSA
jgi:hypothetical protein